MKTIFGLFLFFFACLTARAADTDERIEIVLNGGLMASVRNTQVEGRPIAACHFVELQYLDGTVVQVTEAYAFQKGHKLFLPKEVVEQSCDRDKVADWFRQENDLLQHPVGNDLFEIQAARMKARKGKEVARVIPPPQPPPSTQPPPPPPKRVSVVYGPPAPKPVVIAKAPLALVPPPVVNFQALERNGLGQLPSATEQSFALPQMVNEEPKGDSKTTQEALEPPRFPWVWVGVTSLAIMMIAGFFAARICRVDVEKLNIGTKVPRNVISMKQTPTPRQAIPVAVATGSGGLAVASSAPAFQPVVLTEAEKFILLYQDLEKWYKSSSVGEKVSGITFLNKSDGPRLVVHCSGDSDNVKLAIFKRLHHKHAGLMVTYKVVLNHLGSDIVLKIA